MNIAFEEGRKLADVQKDFSLAFPYLKLDFVAKQRQTSDDNARALLMANGLTIGDINKNIAPGSIEITDDTTVAGLEKLFSGKMGLAVRVLRKSGNIWMETSITNNWTLGQQNQHAKEISSNPRIF
jgi:hypothetical protein